jgi:hypothetical protein
MRNPLALENILMLETFRAASLFALIAIIIAIIIPA